MIILFNINKNINPDNVILCTNISIKHRYNAGVVVESLLHMNYI